MTANLQTSGRRIQSSQRSRLSSFVVNSFLRPACALVYLLPAIALQTCSIVAADEPTGPPAIAQHANNEQAPPVQAIVDRAFIDGQGPGWRTLTEADFERVNLQEDTWTWEGTLAKCSGKPIGVERTKEQFTNFELVAHWRHLSAGGNSGFFIWASPEGMRELKPNALPTSGIEVQVLDHGYTQQYESATGKPGNWFSTHGDIFPVGTSRLKPFPPLSPNGQRSFPSKNLSRKSPAWNHYYVRAINGEVRLWVNGEEVSGGSGAEPATGHICLESEGAPVEFRDIRIRVLP